ncbi:hypothetical protein BH18THE1_BH18THE1_01700 [soil metagenome]
MSNRDDKITFGIMFFANKRIWSGADDGLLFL